MPIWTPEELWKGQDAFIIGGGPSLQGFDWSLLHSELTIGCNMAFTLGPQVCKICVFGDNRWWQKFHRDLESFSGVVFTNHPDMLHSSIPWLWTMKRELVGLHRNALGWNGHTGSVAINLALLLGARRVFLLGFDMRRVGDRSNWHEQVICLSATRPHIYRNFVKDFVFIANDWHRKFPDREIWNVTDDSGLPDDVIPWVPVAEFWSRRTAERKLKQMDVPELARA